MSIRHINGRDDRYIITTHNDGKRVRRWIACLDDLSTQASAEVAWLHSGHGWGFKIGRNGMESDIGLDVHAGRIGSIYLRLRSPWTKWTRVDSDPATRPADWYHARGTGIRFHGWTGNWVHIQIEAREGTWSRDDPWWREMRFGIGQIVGRRKTERAEVAIGETIVPMPEGTYPATWVEEETTSRYVRWPFRLLPAKVRRSVRLDIPGGIPHWGKGENSWDCGMDGLFGTGGRTVADAVGNAVASSMRDRERYGPVELPRAMTVREAEQWAADR